MTNFDPVLIILENMVLMEEVEAVWEPRRCACGLAAILVYALGGYDVNTVNN